jgi:hypothetical protein
VVLGTWESHFFKWGHRPDYFLHGAVFVNNRGFQLPPRWSFPFAWGLSLPRWLGYADLSALDILICVDKREYRLGTGRFKGLLNWIWLFSGLGGVVASSEDVERRVYRGLFPSMVPC